jgi:catechol 2,3-dioxygenase-like lactoylglutathione lyase family enzyme
MRPQPLLSVADVDTAGRFYAGHHHGPLADPGVPLGNGVAVWFSTDAFDAAVARVRALGAELVHDVHITPNARQREIWLRDPAGYMVVLAEG